MIGANDNRKDRSCRIDIDRWHNDYGPYLLSMFDPAVQPEPIISEMFDTVGEAMAAARHYARIHGPARIHYDTGGMLNELPF